MGVTLGNFCCCCCRCAKHNHHSNRIGVIPEKKLKVLVLGLSGSGKTEIAHFLNKTKRPDFEATNGVHNYIIDCSGTRCSLTEVGGSEDMRKIWHHYYIASMGLIFCFDMSLNYRQLRESFAVLRTTLKHPHVRGKPVLLVATRADVVDESVQLYDIENAFQIDALARFYTSTIKLCYYGMDLGGQFGGNNSLCSGIRWLVQCLLDNYNVLQMRLNCDRNMLNWEAQRNKLIAEGKLDLRSYQRFPRPMNRQKFWRLSQKRRRRSLIRPRTAPPVIYCVPSCTNQPLRTVLTSTNTSSGRSEVANGCNGVSSHNKRVTDV